MNRLFFPTLFLLFVLVGAEVDLFVPSFPELQQVFGLTPFMVELTLGVNLIAYCITSLFSGSLGDRFGCKIVIQVGLLIFIIGSTLCMLAPYFSVLLLGRALQGVGIAAPAVLGYIVVSDHYSAEEQQKIMGVLNGSITLAMALAPVVGSYVSLWFHWQGNFYALFIFGLLCLTMVQLFLPTTQGRSHVSLSLKGYLPVLRSKTAMLAILNICFILLPYWIFISLSPILYMEDLGVPLKHFGFYQGTMAFIYSVCSFTSGKFIAKVGQQRALRYSFVFVATFMIVASAMVLYDVRNPILITIFIQTLPPGTILLINILYPLSLETVPEAKGRISGLFVAIRMVMTTLLIQSISYVYDCSFKYIGLGMVFCLMAFAINYRYLYKTAPAIAGYKGMS